MEAISRALQMKRQAIFEANITINELVDVPLLGSCQFKVKWKLSHAHVQSPIPLSAEEPTPPNSAATVEGPHDPTHICPNVRKEQSSQPSERRVLCSDRKSAISVVLNDHEPQGHSMDAGDSAGFADDGFIAAEGASESSNPLNDTSSSFSVAKDGDDSDSDSEMCGTADIAKNMSPESLTTPRLHSLPSGQLEAPYLSSSSKAGSLAEDVSETRSMPSCEHCSTEKMTVASTHDSKLPVPADCELSTQPSGSTGYKPLQSHSVEFLQLVKCNVSVPIERDGHLGPCTLHLIIKQRIQRDGNKKVVSKHGEVQLDLSEFVPTLVKDKKRASDRRAATPTAQTSEDTSKLNSAKSGKSRSTAFSLWQPSTLLRPPSPNKIVVAPIKPLFRTETRKVLLKSCKTNAGLRIQVEMKLLQSDTGYKPSPNQKFLPLSSGLGPHTNSSASSLSAPQSCVSSRSFISGSLPPSDNARGFPHSSSVEHHWPYQPSPYNHYPGLASTSYGPSAKYHYHSGEDVRPAVVKYTTNQIRLLLETKSHLKASANLARYDSHEREGRRLARAEAKQAAASSRRRAHKANGSKGSKSPSGSG